METSALFEARSAPLPYPTGSSARTDPRGRAGSNVRPYRDSFLPLVAQKVPASCSPIQALAIRRTSAQK